MDSSAEHQLSRGGGGCALMRNRLGSSVGKASAFGTRGLGFESDQR